LYIFPIFATDLKQLLAILFLIAFFWQPVYQTGYIGYWELNKDKIVKTECVNRFKPMMHCNGKCQLYRQLKKAADEEAENNKLPMTVLKLKQLDSFIVENNGWQCSYFESKGVKANSTNLTTNLKKGHLLSLYKPPQF
jgi:hypothetical protein